MYFLNLLLVFLLCLCGAVFAEYTRHGRSQAGDWGQASEDDWSSDDQQVVRRPFRGPAKGGYGGGGGGGLRGYGSSSSYQKQGYGGGGGGGGGYNAGYQGGYGDQGGKPMPYEFNYDFNDDFGGSQSRKEEQDSNGNVQGSYSYTDPYGIFRKVTYTAGPEGFRAVVHSNEPGLGTTDNPADVEYHVQDPPAGAYGSGNKKSGAYSAGPAGGGYSKRGGGGGGGAGYRQVQADYSNIMQHIVHNIRNNRQRKGGRNPYYSKDY